MGEEWRAGITLAEIALAIAMLRGGMTRTGEPPAGAPPEPPPPPAAGRATGAEDAANAVRLRARLAGEEIAAGHSFPKHVVERGEFPGVTTRAEFAKLIENVIANGEARVLARDRTAYWLDGVIVIRNPNAVDGGTVFRPPDGYSYFLTLN
jgi:hypothetical protein